MSKYLKYTEIQNYIRAMIETGDIKQGGKLPSIRQMSERMHCSKGTVIHAYKLLEREHIVYSIPQSGYYLIEKAREDTGESEVLVDFTTATPEERLLPYQSFEHCMSKAIQVYKDSLFTYGSTKGLTSLRSILIEHFTQRQVYARLDDVFITSGAQQAIYLILKTGLDESKKSIVIEQPTYSGILRLLETSDYKSIGIKRTETGLDIRALEKAFKTGDVRYYYTIPNYHNPLGSSLTTAEKQKILRLANKYDVMIIEDDYLGDLNLDPKNYPLHYYDTENRVIYITSFSKSFMPGIRIGAVVLPDQLQESFSAYKRCCDLNTSVLAQGGLELFISTGMYNRHIIKVRQSFKEKMMTIKAVAPALGELGVKVYPPATGIFVWLELPLWCNANKLANRLTSRMVFVIDGRRFFLREEAQMNAIRLCLANLSREQVEKGMLIILDEIKAIRERQ